ncbi:MAG: IPT/TIG domain-containing protein [Deltaproteobacteria bacterium]|nr:IPT/TIG domain-containing protein [Deltaproteobacteria bacterium]
MRFWRGCVLGVLATIGGWVAPHFCFAGATGLPVVNYTDIIAGPNSGGENNNGCYVTINGRNFGSMRGTSTVTVGGGEVAAYKYWSETQVSVQLGPRTRSGPLVLSVGGLTVAAPDFFTIRPGNFYYVATWGNDASGVVNDPSRPFRTPNAVMAMPDFSAGDFMILRGGTYDLSSGNENLYNNRWLNVGVGNGRTPAVGGTSPTNAITIAGYPGEDPVVDWGSINTTGVAGIRCVVGVEHYVFANMTFDLRDSGNVAIYLGFYSDPRQYLNYPRLVNLRVRGGMAGASSGVNVLALQRCIGIKVYGLDIGNQSALAVPDLASHVIYLSHFYTDGEIAWSRIHDNRYGRAALQIAGDGWGTTPFSSENGTWGTNTNVRIHDNIFENLAEEAILCNLGSFEIAIYNNVFRNCMTKKNGGFSPIALRGAGLAKGIYRLFNNTVLTDAPDASPGGIIQMGYSPQGTYPEKVYIYNNIIMAISADTNYFQINHISFDASRIDSRNNIWYGSSDKKPAWALSDEVEADPKFVNAVSGRLDLRWDSPAIDHGTDAVAPLVSADQLGTRKPARGGYDIGAYEFQVAPPREINMRLQ